MRSSLLRSLFLVGAVSLSQGCVMMSAEVDKIEQELDQADFPASPISGQMMNETQPVSLNVATQLTDLFDNVQLTEMKFRASTGIVNMDFVKTIRVSFLADETHPAVTIAEFVRDSATGSSDTLTAKIDRSFDHTPYILHNKAMTLQVEAMAPTSDWGIKATVAVSAKANKSYGL